MPDHRRHRGPHPEDHRLFGPDSLPALRSAVADFSLLLTRGYATPSALKLVGDRYSLTERQRTAVQRASCSGEAMANRKDREIPLSSISDSPLLIDGYNLLTTLETALSLGPIFSCRDGCYRDMASVHGTYRNVEETTPALHLLADFLAEVNTATVTFFLDSPVSNSGRLKTMIHDLNHDWDIQLVPNPDPILAASPHTVVTADSVILDGCARWTNLARAIITARIPQAWLVDLESPATTGSATPPAAPQ